MTVGLMRNDHLSRVLTEAVYEARGFEQLPNSDQY
jgi:hypothetical protein